MHEPQAKANLLTKTLCPGVGQALRLAVHCPCKTREWHTFIGCGGDGYDVPSRPCVDCGVNTCDECRTHVVYQVYMQELGLDKRRWWAGHFLNVRTPFAIYPPKGVDVDESTWHLPADLTKSHHDQGRIHIPLHIASIADPEPLDRILDTNLGRRHVTPAGRTDMPYEGDQLVAFFEMVAHGRRELVCTPCFNLHQEAKKNPARCSCTFRKRFLDRWLCIPCHETEAARDEKLLERLLVDTETGHVHARSCRCGDRITCCAGYKIICNWCDGQVEYAKTEDEAEDDDAAVTFVDNDDDEEHAAPVPDDLMPDTISLAENKDGTVSAFFNDDRISGERLGYQLFVQHAVDNGVKLGCTCCKCPGMGYGHDHGSDDEDGDEDGDEEEGGFGWEDMNEDANSDSGWDGEEGYDGIEFDEEGDEGSPVDFDEESDDGGDLPDLVEQ
jgi:hypothetical protein